MQTEQVQASVEIIKPAPYTAHGFYLEEPTDKPLEGRLTWQSELAPTTEMLQHICNIAFKLGYDTVLISFADGSTRTVELW